MSEPWCACGRSRPDCDGSRLGCADGPWRAVTPVEAMTVREAARRRMPLDGADAQALEGALALTERERDQAREKAAQYERDWYAAKSEFGTAAAKLREVLRQETRVSLDYQAQRDDARRRLRAVCDLLAQNGCDCDCDHDAESHDDDCERCLACRVSEAVG